MLTMSMNYQYVQSTKRLNVYGSNGPKDIQDVKKLIDDGEIPSEISTLFYQRSSHSVVGMLFRGKYLENLLKKTDDTEPEKPKPNFRNILKAVNEANTRQVCYTGLLVFSTNAKRFLFFKPKTSRNYGLLGDFLKEGDLPAETLCRIADEECRIELTPDCLVTLQPVEIDGTTYHNYLVLSNHEFKVSLSERFTGSTWRSYDALEELPLHPAIGQLFEKDEKLHKLIAPIQMDFDKLIEEILHSR